MYITLPKCLTTLAQRNFKCKGSNNCNGFKVYNALSRDLKQKIKNENFEKL